MKSGTGIAVSRSRWNRRGLLMGIFTLGAWLAFRKSAIATPADDKTVMAGGWVLKKSDLS